LFAELPKLFDRDFVVGFFLPAVLLGGGGWLVLSAFGIAPNRLSFESWSSSAIAIATVWLISIALLAFNYQILRFLEGYTWQHLFKQRARLWKGRFRKTARPALLLQKEFDVAREQSNPDPSIPSDFKDIPDFLVKLRIAVENFPDEEDWILPTKFGNVFRSLEVYSRVVYGIDAIPAWPRLQAVLPEQFKKQLGEAKSLMDFFVNLMVGGGIISLLYLVIAVWTWRLPSAWVPLLAIAVSTGSYWAALVEVGQYGTHVKSAFDLYRGELAK